MKRISRRVILALLSLLLIGAVVALFQWKATAPPMDGGQARVVKVATLQIVDYELIARMRTAFERRLESHASTASDFTVRLLPYVDAHNDVNLLNQIADSMVADKPDLIYVLGTPAAQALIERTTSIPIVQGAATDPVASGFAASWNGSGRNYAASTDYPPVIEQIAAIKGALPAAKRVGVLYSSGESQSRALVERLRVAAAEADLQVVERAVTGSSEVFAATNSLVGTVDLIYIPTDNTVIDSLLTVVEVARSAKLPIVACTREDVERGALFAVGARYEELAEIAADIAFKIISGEAPGAIPIAFAKDVDVFWNPDVAAQLNIERPTDWTRVVEVPTSVR